MTNYRDGEIITDFLSTKNLLEEFSLEIEITPGGTINITNVDKKLESTTHYVYQSFQTIKECRSFACGMIIHKQLLQPKQERY